MSPGSILVINTGSSSLKCGLYVNKGNRGNDDTPILDATADDAFDRMTAWLTEHADTPVAIGHRVVHGGPHLTTHQRITPAVRETLGRAIHFAPLHLPRALEFIDLAARRYPNIPQFACFDTTFHRTIPEVAARFALPRQLYAEGVRRYGFHGLSYESILHQLGHDRPARLIVAHLGSGASLAAVQDGQSVDTTMGLTPTGGIPMGTRPGDVDPGVLLYLLREKRLTVDALESLLNHDSGLKGLSGRTGDMRELEAAASAGDADAALAIDVFCRSIRKVIAAYTTVLEGLDLLVFTGGIGENSTRVRDAVTHGVPNTAQVRVLPSQEDQQIARHCRALLTDAAGSV
jgi:acetate kinase